MALPTLFDGADCGPVNPLNLLTKQFDTSRGAQQDFFGTGYASRSQQHFRTQGPQSSAVQEATRFFVEDQTRQIPTLHSIPPGPFDINTLRTNLPEVEYSIKSQHQFKLAGGSSWSNEFLKQGSQVEGAKTGFNLEVSQRQLPKVHFPQILPTSEFKQPIYTSSIPRWKDLDFPHVEESSVQRPYPIPEQSTAQVNAVQPTDADELSKTAGLLINAVQQEANTKFKNSAFLSLMRQLRDREVTIQGTEMIQIKDNALIPSSVDVKGKGRAEPISGFTVTPQDTPNHSVSLQDHVGPSTAVTSSIRFEQFPSVKNGDPIPSINEMETDDDRFWKEENNAYKQYWSHKGTSVHGGNHRDPEWDQLQEDWDKFEATSTGIKTASSYPFQTHNPYSQPSFRIENSISVGQPLESLLELEADVQRNLHDPVRWYRLGVKQQENEREQNAILALQRATELDPFYLEAWLALAVSRTNEGDRLGAYDAIRNWLNNNPKYKHEIIADSPDNSPDGDLMQRLMLLIRQTSEKEIDADLQTALGVVLNTTESFERAQDCFLTALSVRPDDWLLYNRVGATLANSGRAKDAVWYYHQALALNPSYIRARFNLGISYINMKQYYEAARHILDALVLQENDTSDGNTRGVTSSTLWECLRTTCVHLQRTDLATFCDTRNLEGFRGIFMNQ